MKLGHQSKGMGGLVSIDSYSHMSDMIFDLVSQFLVGASPWLRNLCEPSIEALVPRLQTDPSVSTAPVSGQDIENFLYSKTSSKPLFRNILSSLQWKIFPSKRYIFFKYQFFIKGCWSSVYGYGMIFSTLMYVDSRYIRYVYFFICQNWRRRCMHRWRHTARRADYRI